MKYLIILAIFSGLLVTASSCYYDKEDLLYGGGNTVCTDSSTVVSYSTQVVPVLQQYCYSCHSGGFPSGGIAMGTYASDKAIGQNGKLYGSISYAPGYSPMPKGMTKMTSCQIALIQKWINNGMPNN